MSPRRSDPPPASAATDLVLERQALTELGRLVEKGEEERARALAGIESSDPRLAARLRVLLAAPSVSLDLASAETEAASVEGENEETAPSTGEPAPRRLPPATSTQTKFGLAFPVLAVCGLVLYAWAASLFYRYGSEAVPEPFRGSWHGREMRVEEVMADGAGAGKLKAGDRILSVNGKANRLLPFWLAKRQFYAAGSYSLEGVRGVHPFRFVLEPKVRPGQIDVPRRGLFALISFAFFVTACLLGFARPPTKVKRLGSLALLGEALVLLEVAAGGYFDVETGVDSSLDRLLLLASGVHFAFAYHFFTTFFDQLRGAHRRRFSVAAFYIWGLFCAVCLQFACGAFQTEAILNAHQLLLLSLRISTSFYLVAPATICVFVAIHISRVHDPMERLRAKWIGYGSIAGTAPYVLFRLASVVIARWKFPYLSELLNAGFAAALIASLAIPFSLAYAILKHQVMDIRILTRKSLANKFFLPSVQLALVLMAAAILISVLRNRSITEALMRSAGSVALMVLLGCIVVFYERGRRWWDRYCGRDPVYRGYLIESASASLRQTASAEDFVAALTRHVNELLRPNASYIFLDWEWDGRYRTAGIAGGGSSFDRGSSLYQSLLSGPANSITVAELERVALGIPMKTRKGRVAGFLLIGERRSSDEYLAADKELLLGLAETSAAAFEHMQLEKQVERQAAAEQLCKECPKCRLCFDHEVTECPQDGERLEPRPWPRRIDGRYRLLARVGEGGMGVVYRAWAEKLGCEMAVKFIVTSGLPGSEGRLRRALQEAPALASIAHPNIVRVYDSGPVNERIVFIAMEFVEGSTLRQRLDGKEMTSRAEAADWFEQLLEGLAVAHGKGIVHRDLKPENLMLTKAGRLVILDFGIARLVAAEEGTRMTAPGWNPGTNGYMSPEQAEGRAVDARSDLYTVGLMVAEVLTGQVPSVVARETAEDFSFGSDETGFGLTDVARRCLAREPALRPKNAEELRSELIPLLRGKKNQSAGAAG